MRRSRTVTLTLLAASAVALQACGDDVASTAFFATDTAACMARYGAQAEAECNAAMGQAQREHLATAPRFATVEQCREETGGECEATPARIADKGLLSGGGTSVAMP